MKLLVIALIVSASFFNYHSCFGQNDTLLNAVPKSNIEYNNTEKNALAIIYWLENTPLNQDELQHKQQYKLLLAWIIESPNFTINLHASMVRYSKKNTELLFFFFAGYAKYCLTNNYSKDSVQGNLAGIRCAIRTYKKGIKIEKDDIMEELIKLDAENKLEAWVRDNINKD